MRLVLDTNVVIAGLLWVGTPRRLLDRAINEACTLYSSPALIDERASKGATTEGNAATRSYWLGRTLIWDYTRGIGWGYHHGVRDHGRNARFW